MTQDSTTINFRKTLGLLLLLILPSFSIQPVQASEARPEARVIRGKKNRIPELSWTHRVETKMVQAPEGFRLTGKLTGTLTSPAEGWRITINQQEVTFSSENIEGGEGREFSVELPLVGRKTSINVELTDPEGKTKTERIGVVFSKWDKLSETLTNFEELIQEKHSLFIVSLGDSAITYSETGISEFSQKVFRAKISYQNQWHPRWSYLLKTVGDILPVASTPSGMLASFINSDFLFIYSPPWFQKPWSIDLFGGIHHSMMFSYKGMFGHAPLLYPQFYPSIRRSVSSTSSIALSMGYTPLGFSSSESEYEFQAELGWQYRMRSENWLCVSFDYRDFRLSPKAGSRISSQVIGLNVGYGW